MNSTSNRLANIPPAGVPSEIAQNWVHLPWRTRQKWTARDYGQERAEREARYKAATTTVASGGKRPTAETMRLVEELTADGLTAVEIVARLEVTASAIESALRKQRAPTGLRLPYRRLAETERDARRCS